MASQQEISDYYDKNQILYDVFYSKGTGGLHYGFWDENTQNHPESIMNTTKFVAKCLNVNQNDKILDAGCGIGSSCIYMAKRYGVQVEGITLSDVQIEKARINARKLDLHKQVKFSKQDYANTRFSNEYFTIIFGVESICHSEKKIEFLNEAYRLLKKGGKVTVSDGFQIKKTLSEKENNIYHNCLRGWAISNLATLDGFRKDLIKAGFRNIQYYDKFEEIKKTRDRIFLIGLFGYPFTWLLSKMNLFT